MPKRFLLGIATLVGVAALSLSLRCYRRRRMEPDD